MMFQLNTNETFIAKVYQCDTNHILRAIDNSFSNLEILPEIMHH